MTIQKLNNKQKGSIAAVVVMMIAGTIGLEGGWVNDKDDPGGETNMGITKVVAVQNGYTGPMKTLPYSVAESIYYEDYIIKPGYLPLVDIDAAVTEELYDTTVNMGANRPSRWFQKSINELSGAKLAVDGKVGSGTISAFKSYQNRVTPSVACVNMLNALDNKQLNEYNRLVKVNPKLKKFYKGWVRARINNVSRTKCKVTYATN